MVCWKTLSIAALLGLSPIKVLCQNGTANYHRVKIIASSITIKGETNVNKFECSMNQPATNDSILVKNIWLNQKLEFQGLRLSYLVNRFDCGMKAMNSDFQELLKEDIEPYLFLQLNSITLLPGNDAFEELDVDAEVEVFIAGVRKDVKILGGKVYNKSSAHMILKGEKDLLITDFNIEPPTKMFGLIQVTDNIRIEFSISMVVSAL